MQRQRQDLVRLWSVKAATLNEIWIFSDDLINVHSSVALEKVKQKFKSPPGHLRLAKSKYFFITVSL